jgi:eukaryotic-like serine/threonine-protein kinase
MTWTVPGYEVRELLGYGGSGEVWRGQANATGTAVALKRLPVEDAAGVQAARAEAALLSTLDHPHLMRMHELVPVEGGVVLVLDLAAGGSLADLLARRGRLTPGEVISTLSPIGAALAYAHNEGVVHGDVTPANVLFTEAGLPLLTDLGVARIVGDSASARSTPAYVDPWVAAGHTPGAPSDVFMLGAVAVHALTGTPVWTGVTPEDTLARAAAGDVGDLPARLAQLPPDLAALLERALHAQPHLRCNAAEFALDLRHCGPPAPVELAAGRAADVSPPPSGDSPADDSVGGDPSRPSFNRPGYDVPSSDPAQLTHGVRAALHAPVPRPRSRSGVVLRHPATRVTALLVVLLAAGVVAAVHWAGGRSAGGRSADGRSAGGRSAAQASTTVPAPVPPPTSARPSGPRSPAERAAGLLRDLDGIREQAFARRDASMLARVYVDGPLLAQDTALLQRVVPTGCGLVGVHTSYTAVQASGPDGGRLVLNATASLAPSTLRCPGAAAASAAGEGPTRLRIELVRRAGSYRIASQQRLT